MKAEYAIVIDRPHGALHVSMGGFFTQADVEAFLLEVYAKLDALGLPQNAHLMLCDVREMKIQTQKIVGAFSQVVGNPRSRSKRLAFVTGSSLSRLQARRLTQREGVAYFSDMAEARGWLFDPAHAMLSDVA